MNHIWLPGRSFESVKQLSWPARGVNCGVNEPACVKSDFYLCSSHNITKTSYARVPMYVQCTFTSRWSQRTRPCTRVTLPSCTARPPGTPSRTSTGWSKTRRWTTAGAEGKKMCPSVFPSVVDYDYSCDESLWWRFFHYCFSLCLIDWVSFL